MPPGSRRRSLAFFDALANRLEKLVKTQDHGTSFAHPLHIFVHLYTAVQPHSRFYGLWNTCQFSMCLDSLEAKCDPTLGVGFASHLVVHLLEQLLKDLLHIVRPKCKLYKTLQKVSSCFRRHPICVPDLCSQSQRPRRNSTCFLKDKPATTNETGWETKHRVSVKTQIRTNEA